MYSSAYDGPATTTATGNNNLDTSNTYLSSFAQLNNGIGVSSALNTPLPEGRSKIKFTKTDILLYRD